MEQKFPNLFHVSFQVITSYGVALHNNKYISFSTLVLFMEIHQMFYNADRLLRAVGVSESGIIYRVNAILVLVACILFRQIFTCWLLYIVITQGRHIPTFHFLLSCGTLTYLTFCTNIWLCKKAWSNVVEAWLN